MRRIGLCISLLVTVLAMSACESEGEAQTFADRDQKMVKQTATKPMSNKKKQDFKPSRAIGAGRCIQFHDTRKRSI